MLYPILSLIALELVNIHVVHGKNSYEYLKFFKLFLQYMENLVAYKGLFDQGSSSVSLQPSDLLFRSLCEPQAGSHPETKWPQQSGPSTMT